MNRIMIIGCCGSGKSTIARELHKITGIPLYHLDQYYWKPNWTETPNEQWEEIVTDLSNKENWIIDGNYGGTWDIRFARANTIIYMDIPTGKCLKRVIGRIWKYHGKVRPDMPPGCKERFDFDFLHYVAIYNMLRRKKLLKKLDSFEETKKVFRIKNDRDIKTLLTEMKDSFS